MTGSKEEAQVSWLGEADLSVHLHIIAVLLRKCELQQGCYELGATESGVDAATTSLILVIGREELVVVPEPLMHAPYE